MDAMQFLRGVENPMQPYALPHLGLSADALRNRTAAQIIAGAQAQYADTMARAPFYIRYTLESLLQSFDDLNELSAALGVPVNVLAQQLASDPDQERQAYQAQLDAQREAQRIEAERIAYAQMLADIDRQGREEQARIDAYIAQTQAEVAAFEANFQAMLAEQARLEAERQAALKAEQEAAERAQFEADNAQRLALAAELQRIAESGSVPVEAMIATGQFTQAQLDIAAEVQAGQLAAQQEATRLDLASQDAEQRAKVNVELAAQAQAEAQAIAEEQAAIDANIQAYIAQDQAARSAELAFLTVAEDVSRGIDATAVVTAPAAPSDAVLTEPEIIYDIPFPDVSIREVPETTPPVETPAPATGDAAMEQYVFGDITLPQGWYQFTPTQKANWFNQNNVTPTRLRAAGVTDQDIIYLRQAGYTIQDATTVAPVSPVAPAAGNLLPLALAAAFVLFGG